jgi:peptide/nickel transport system permease protein
MIAESPAQLRLAASARPRQVTRAVCLVILAIVLLAALFGRLVYPQAMTINILATLETPGSPGHLLGTDQLGRDVVAMTVAGTASSLIGPAVVAIGAMLIGTFFGLIAGYLHGAFDFAVGRVTDLLLALPMVLLGAVISGVFGASYWWSVLLLIVLFSPYDVRVVRSGVVEQVSKPYIEAAKQLHLSSWRIMFRHLLINLWPLERTNLLLNFANALITMSALSYLGVGVPPGTANWGRQLIDGQDILLTNPAAAITPALMIVIVSCAVNLLADSLNRDEQGVQS